MKYLRNLWYLLVGMRGEGMLSDKIMFGFLVAYFILAVICLFERNYPRALYWTAAGLITVSVLWGMRI
jgi:hypothetical protein